MLQGDLPNMARLVDLPTELILMMICEMACEMEDPHSMIRVGLGSLARTNRRLRTITEPILYKFGLDKLNHLPLLWAAKSGNSGTLRKALAAGAKVDYEFVANFTRGDLAIIHGLTEASVAWRTQNPQYWPPNDRGTVQRQAGLMLRDLPQLPGTVDLDVFAPTIDPALGFSRQLVARVDSTHLNHDVGEYSYEHSDSSSTGPFDSDLDLQWNIIPLTRAYQALHVAVQQGHLGIANSLLDAGAPIDATCANLCGCKPAVGVLLEFLEGPIEYAEDPPLRWSALHLAICSSRPDVAKLLISRGAQFAFDEDYQPIHQVASEGHVDLLQHMLDADPSVDVDQDDLHGFTPLYYAVANRHWESTVPLLIEKGACVDRFHHVGWGRSRATFTLLGEACRLGRFKDALRLIELGANVSAHVEIFMALQTDESIIINNEVPLLHLCCMKPRVPLSSHAHLERISEDQKSFLPLLITRLLSSGASREWVSVDYRDAEFEETPLSVALWHGNLEALQALRDAGIDMLACDSKGRSTLMLALSSGPLVMHSFLATLFTCLRRDEETTYEVLKFLLDSGVDIKHQDSNGNNILHWFFGCYVLDNQDGAFFYDRIPALEYILRYLLAKGADPLVRNERGHCAVHLILQARFYFAMKILVQSPTINIFSVLSVPEICLMLLKALSPKPAGECGVQLGSCGHRHDPEMWRCSSDDFIECIIDMDHERVLTTDPSFLAYCINTTSDEDCMPLWRVAEIIWRRGHQTLEIASIEMLRFLLKVVTSDNVSWGMARQMLDALPDDHIDKFASGDEGGETLLYRAIRQLWEILGPYHSRRRDDFIKHLVHSRGANIHLAMPLPRRTKVTKATTLSAQSNATGISQAICRHREKGHIMTPLLRVIYATAENSLIDEYWVEWMLRMQPIRGNPQAERMLYLHKAVNLQAVLDAPDEKKKKPHFEPPKLAPVGQVIRALLEAGADRTELDDEGNTPLSVMLSWLVKRKDLVERCIQFLRPLSMGVDVHRKNKIGRSVVDYLEELIFDEEGGTDGSSGAASCVKSYLELVRLENGDREIKWRRGAW